MWVTLLFGFLGPQNSVNRGSEFLKTTTPKAPGKFKRCDERLSWKHSFATGYLTSAALRNRK